MSNENYQNSSRFRPWACWLTSNINNKLAALSGKPQERKRTPSPPTSYFPEHPPTNPAPLRRSRSQREKQRPVSFYLPSAPTLHSVHPNETTQDSSNRPKISRRDSMPAGEHSAAARSRLRYKAERHKSRSSQSGSLSRSSSVRNRRESTAAQYDEAEESQDLLLSTENLQEIKARNRLSQPTMSSTDLARLREKWQKCLSEPNMSSRDLARFAAQNLLCPPGPEMDADASVEDSSRQKAYNRLSLPIIPASPIDSETENDQAFSTFAKSLRLGGVANAMFGSVASRQHQRGRSHTRRQTQLWDSLTSLPTPCPPRTEFSKPSALLPKSKGCATTLENRDSAHRLSTDTSRLPLSAKLQALHVWFYGTSPDARTLTVLEQRPPSSWLISGDEEPSRAGTSHGPQSLGREWNVGTYGKRKFEGGSGFWGW